MSYLSKEKSCKMKSYSRFSPSAEKFFCITFYSYYVWKLIYTKNNVGKRRYCCSGRPRDQYNRYNFFNAFTWESKSYDSFRLTVYVSALFCKQQDMETMKYTKNVFMKSLILFEAIYQMHAMLNLLIIHKKQKIVNITLLVKQKTDFKNTVNLRARRTRKERYTWHSTYLL